MGYVRNKIRASKLSRRNPDELIPPRTRVELTFPDGQVFEATVVSHDYDDDAKTRPLLDCLIFTGLNDSDKFDGFRQGSNLDTRRDVSARSLGHRVEMSQRDLVKWFTQVPKLGSNLLKPYQVRALTKRSKSNPSREDQIKTWHDFRNKISRVFNGFALTPTSHCLDRQKLELAYKFRSADYEAVRDAMDIDGRGYPLDEYEIIGGKDPNILYFAPKSEQAKANPTKARLIVDTRWPKKLGSWTLASVKGAEAKYTASPPFFFGDHEMDAVIVGPRTGGGYFMSDASDGKKLGQWGQQSELLDWMTRVK